jgi:hypothetical protein
MRNRFIAEAKNGNGPIVLLDENLVKGAFAFGFQFVSCSLTWSWSPIVSYKSPLHVREQSKKILRTSLFNDTLFLSNMNVMDYSLGKDRFILCPSG